MASVSLHNCIVRNNVLTRPTSCIKKYLEKHPNLLKTALIINHLFRAVAMMGMCMILPVALPVSMGICFAGSLFYRLTVETNCAYKFALPAFAGSIAIPLAIFGLTQIITGLAFASLAAFSLAFLALIPLAAYMTYIVLTVNYDVNDKLEIAQ